jgi:hypothetical protein
MVGAENIKEGEEGEVSESDSGKMPQVFHCSHFLST